MSKMMSIDPTASEVEIDKKVNISEYIERNASELRTEFLSFINNLGERLRTEFHIKKYGFSLWDASTLGEKSPLYGGWVYEVFRLRAIERIYLENGNPPIRYCGLTIDFFEFQNLWIKKMRKDNKNVFFHMFEAVIWFLRRLRHQTRILKGQKNLPPLDGVTIVSYAPAFDLEKASHGRYFSAYFQGLHDVLEASRLKINWVLIYAESATQSYQNCAAYVDNFNLSNSGKQRYYLKDEFLSPALMLKALLGWLRILIRGHRLKRGARSVKYPLSKISIFSALEEQWNRSFIGKVAIENFLDLEAYGEMASSIPAEPFALYLCEKIRHEPILINSWRSKNVKRILGYQFLPLSFFDCRMFDSDSNKILSPDKLLVIGESSRDLLLRSGVSLEKIEIVEATRYMYLSKNRNGQLKAPKEVARTLLVVTGFMSSTTESQMHLLDSDEVKSVLKRKFKEIIFKPHPFFEIDHLISEFNFPIPIRVLNENLRDLWSVADIVFTANCTSAVLESLWLGIPTISAPPLNGLNLNPLVGFVENCCVSTATELAAFLDRPNQHRIPVDFFAFSEGFKKWKKVMNLS